MYFFFINSNKTTTLVRIFHEILGTYAKLEKENCLASKQANL